MRNNIIIFLVLSACASAHADEPSPPATVDVVSLPVLDMVQHRIITVTQAGVLDANGMNDGKVCISSGPGDSIDYSRCCPQGWFPLALAPGGILCEEE